MDSILRWLGRLALSGDTLSWRRPLDRRGFVILISLIAVAVAGLIMVSTAPDLSGAAVSLKSQELSVALGSLRRAIRSRPMYLTTTSFQVSLPSGDVQHYQTGDYYNAPTLYNRLSDLTYQSQLGKAAAAGDPAPALGAGATFLTTVTTDPYVDIRDWYDPLANPSGIFWVPATTPCATPRSWRGRPSRPT